MRNLILAAILSVGFLAPAFTADAAVATVAATNANCCCGKPVDAKVEAVTVTVEGKTHVVGVCGTECAKVVQADPKKAIAGVEAHNKKAEAAPAK